MDNQTYPRIRVETEALFVVLASALAGKISLLGFEALSYEIHCISDEIRRAEALSMLSLANDYLLITDRAEEDALSFAEQGLHAMDALHLALASCAKADFFCTCDDKLLQKAKKIKYLNCSVISLLDLVVEITK